MTPELSTLKRLLCWRAENTNSMNMTQVNALIADANRDAHDSLDDDDKRNVNRAVQMLQANIRGLGDNGALELLAALGQVLEVDGHEQV